MSAMRWRAALGLAAPKASARSCARLVELRVGDRRSSDCASSASSTGAVGVLAHEIGERHAHRLRDLAQQQ